MHSLKSSIPMSARRTARWTVLPLAMLLISGCGSMGGTDKGFSFKNLLSSGDSPEVGYEQNSSEVDYQQIAENLVHSLIQIPQLNPGIVAIEIPEAETEFDTQVRTALVSSGFKIGLASSSTDALLAGSEIKETSIPSGVHTAYGVSIGDVSIARAYEVVDGLTVPMSPQLIVGTEAQAIEVNDELFGPGDNSLASVEFQAPGSDENVRVMPVTFEKAQPKLLAANSNDVRQQNYFDIGQSNYGGVFDEYEDVISTVLIFPNDSLRLGGSNKAIIDQYVSQMDPDTDVLSVIGCSLGPTTIKNGNSLLAIGRANRVKEAFMFSGLDHDQVLEEGCWAPELVEMELPTRGVVVTLKRQKKS